MMTDIHELLCVAHGLPKRTAQPLRHAVEAAFAGGVLAKFGLEARTRNHARVFRLPDADMQETPRVVGALAEITEALLPNALFRPTAEERRAEVERHADALHRSIFGASVSAETQARRQRALERLRREVGSVVDHNTIRRIHAAAVAVHSDATMEEELQECRARVADPLDEGLPSSDEDN